MMRAASAEALTELISGLGRSGTLEDSAITGADLFGVATVLQGEPALRRVLTDASIEAEAKAGLASSVFSGKVSDKSLAVITDAAKRRWTAGRDLVQAIEHLAVVSTVRSAGARASQLSDELFAVAQVIDGSPELRSALADRTRPTADRSALLAGLLADKVLPATSALVAQAVANPASTVTAALAGYQKIAAEAQDEIVAVVRSARELTAADQERLVGALTKQYATTVHLHLVVDPTLVGGLRVEIGDDVIDGTVVSRLDDARRRLAG